MPRKLGFLLKECQNIGQLLNRLNVATSRAKCVSILVGSPQVFEAECRTPRQIQLSNAFCRFFEMAKRLTVSDAAERLAQRRRGTLSRHMTKSAQEVGTLQSMYWIEIRTVPPVKLPLVAVITIDVAE